MGDAIGSAMHPAALGGTPLRALGAGGGQAQPEMPTLVAIQQRVAALEERPVDAARRTAAARSTSGRRASARPAWMIGRSP